MQSVEEILYLHEDDVVEMKQGGRVPFSRWWRSFKKLLDRYSVLSQEQNKARVRSAEALERLLQKQDELRKFRYNPNFDAAFPTPQGKKTIRRCF